MPAEPDAEHLDAANGHGRGWCDEVNARPHSEICAIPAERLVTEVELLGPLPSLRHRIGRVTLRTVDRLSCVRIDSARYSVPVRLIGHTVEVIAVDGRVKVLDADEIVADHGLVAPGEASVHDDHYRGAPRGPFNED